MISLINALRFKRGLPAVGFINPSLYKSQGSFANDITSGTNKCSASASQCCRQGYAAITGWDPVTGFGSVDFKKLQAIFVPRSSSGGKSLESEEVVSSVSEESATS